MPPPISIIIPALNEAESIGQVVAEMPWHLIAECIVVDNGSTDATASIATQPAPASSSRLAVTEPPASPAPTPRSPPAPSSSTWTATAPTSSPISRASSPPSRTTKPTSSSAPATAAPANPAPCSSPRSSPAISSALLLRILGKGRYTDMGPFRAIRRTSLEKLQMSELTYGWNLEMQIKAAQHHLRILEIPVDYRKRIGGTSKVSGDFKASHQSRCRILQVLFRVGFSRADNLSPLTSRRLTPSRRLTTRNPAQEPPPSQSSSSATLVPAGARSAWRCALAAAATQAVRRPGSGTPHRKEPFTPFSFSKTLEGHTLAVRRSRSGRSWQSRYLRLTFHFRDGSLDDDTTVFTQRESLPAHQRPSRPARTLLSKPLGFMFIDAAPLRSSPSPPKTARPIPGKTIIDLPADLANGLQLTLHVQP